MTLPAGEEGEALAGELNAQIDRVVPEAQRPGVRAFLGEVQRVVGRIQQERGDVGAARSLGVVGPEGVDGQFLARALKSSEPEIIEQALKLARWVREEQLDEGEMVQNVERVIRALSGRQDQLREGEGGGGDGEDEAEELSEAEVEDEKRKGMEMIEEALESMAPEWAKEGWDQIKDAAKSMMEGLGKIDVKKWAIRLAILAIVLVVIYLVVIPLLKAGLMMYGASQAMGQQR